MSAPSGSNAVAQPASFEFTPDNLALANRIIAKYPPGKQQSAVMPLLDLAQRQHDNWLPIAAMEYIAKMLGMAPRRAPPVQRKTPRRPAWRRAGRQRNRSAR